MDPWMDLLSKHPSKEVPRLPRRRDRIVGDGARDEVVGFREPRGGDLIHRQRQIVARLVVVAVEELVEHLASVHLWIRGGEAGLEIDRRNALFDERVLVA